MAKKRRKKSLRSVLRQELRERLSKVFLDKGFSEVPLYPDELGTEIAQAFPLGRLTRKRGDDLDIIEFQFDKYGTPSFVINFGICPKEGVTLPWGDHMEQDNADTSGLRDAYCLYSSSIFKRWFKLGLFSPKDEKAIGRLVDKAIRLSDEVIEWFETGKVGRHMRFFGTVEAPNATEE